MKFEDGLDAIHNWIWGKTTDNMTSIGWLMRIIVGVIFYGIGSILFLWGAILFIAFVLYVIPGGL